MAAAPAYAAVSPTGSQTKTTTGAKATCDVTKKTSSSSSVTCTLSDTLSDGDGVYLVHQVMAFPSKRIDFNGGAGHGTTTTFTVSSDSTSYNWHFKVCRNVSLAPDNCSSYAYFYVS